MQQVDILTKRKQSIAPKITQTKTTISKSTPFFIRKHHLDDTQMRSVLKYDNQTQKNQRTYSYKGEVLSCMSSKIKEPFQTFQNKHNQVIPPTDKKKIEQYYPAREDKLIQVQPSQKNRLIPSMDEQTLRWKNRIDQKPPIGRNTIVYRQNDYGLQEAKHLTQARRRLEKQAKKLRQLYRKNIKKEARQGSANKITDLQDEIRRLKIKNLQTQKQILHKQLLHKTQPLEDPSIAKGPSHFILNKPKFKLKHAKNEETDSSFSSFELQ